MKARPVLLLAVVIILGTAIIAFGRRAIGYAFHLIDHQRSTYATYADAVEDGADRRGWLPRWLPPSARAIEEVHDLDSNRQWLRFELPPQDVAALLAEAGPLSMSEPRRSGVGAPRMRDWPPELARHLIITPRGSLRLARIPDPAPGREAHCLLVETHSWVAYAWSC